MSNENLVCPICGEPTNVYMGKARRDRLCRKHGSLANKGEIVQCEDCGTWNNAGETCSCKKPKKIIKELPKEETSELTCIICGENSHNKEICKSCYYEILNKQEELDRNQKPWELKDYFYNLNSSIYRIKENKYAIGQIYKLFAIAWFVRDVYKDTQLSDIVATYASAILGKRTERTEHKITEEKERSDKDTVAVTNPKNRASDGHICKSKGEVDIDNILYKYHICHAYGLKVKEIPSLQDRTVVADWFIPLHGTKGIYIEYWGMDKQDYQDNKEEKLALYEKYKDKVKLIQIEKNEINDSQTLETNLYQKLVELGWEDNN